MGTVIGKLLRRITKIMPTSEPLPVAEPQDGIERLARQGAVSFIEKFFELLDGYAYSTRSHVPGGLDFTDLTHAMSKVRKFCKARPDWMMEILHKVLASYDLNYVPQHDLDRLRATVRRFEERTGLKLEEDTYNNDGLADAVKAVVAAGGAEKMREQAAQRVSDATHHVRSTLAQLEALIR